jgi:segregation and condensation protein A
MTMLPPLFTGEKYQVSTGLYSGPLDLLLTLIEKAELDITKLALAQVTDQFLAYLEQLTEKDPTEISYFLVVAAKLIQIKSEALLPVPPTRSPGEEDPGESLAQQLLLYKLFKESAKTLALREELKLSTFLHIAPPIKIEEVIDLTGISIDDLAEAARVVLLNQSDTTFGGRLIQMPRYSIREKIGLIVSLLREKGLVSFTSIFDNEPTRLEMVVTFLALLELVKQNMIITKQDGLFSEITLESIGDVSGTQEYDLEFGE